MRIPGWKRTMIGLACLGMLALIAGCAGSSPKPVRSSFVEFTPEQMKEIEAESSDPYRIQPEDVLSIAVSDQKEFQQDHVIVLPDGTVSLMGAGRVELAGLTLDEAERNINSAYAGELREPDVTVVVREIQGTRVYVLGEVRAPGLQKIPSGGLGLVGAVTLAGGFTDEAAPEGAVLIRVNESGYSVQEVDLSNLGDLGSAGLATVGLRPFDVVYVPRSRIADFGYFTRNVISGLVSMTRMAVDIRYLTTGVYRGN